MVKIIGVRFRNAGKVYYFDPRNFDIQSGDHVIVETARGVEYGTVIGNIREVHEESIVQPLKSVLRISTAEDDARAEKNRIREAEAIKICKEKIIKHGLDMKLIDAEYTFDNNKVLFYFTADGRIDFRELVKDLAAVFRMRIELRQIGVRDETKILGGLGICGRVLCCHSYLADFAPVSIKMAKEQNLSLNPTKISGVCGRLMCCLKNEEDTYEYLNSRLPGIGDTVETADGRSGEVSGVNVLRQSVKVLFDVDDEKEMEEFPVEELKFKARRRKDKTAKNSDKSEKGQKISEEESEELSALEALDETSEKTEKEERPDRQEKPRRKNKERSRENRDGKEYREGREKRENRDGKDNREGRENRDGKDNREKRENRDGREKRERRDNREKRENRRDRSSQDGSQKREAEKEPRMVKQENPEGMTE